MNNNLTTPSNKVPFYKQDWFQTAAISAVSAGFGYTVAAVIDNTLAKRRQKRQLEKLLEETKRDSIKIMNEFDVHIKCADIIHQYMEVDDELRQFKPLEEYAIGGIAFAGGLNIQELDDEMADIELLIVKLSEEKHMTPEELKDLIKYYIVLQRAEPNELNWHTAREDYHVDAYYAKLAK